MSEYIKPEIQTLNAYFKNRNEFYIPSYQRPYSWKIENCEQLVGDIITHKENFSDDNNDNYFFGAVLMSHDPNEKHENILIDGQQRTTTFILLLKALLIKINNELKILNNDEDGYLIDKLDEQRKEIAAMIYYFKDEKLKYDYSKGKYIIKDENIKYINNSISEKYDSDLIIILKNESLEQITNDVIKFKYKKNDNKYTNFYKNFKYFCEYTDTMNNTQIRDFTNHLLNNTQFIIITSYNTDQAINIFNSLNGTGLPLTPVEVIVSKVMSNASDEREEFEKNWQNIVYKTDDSQLDLSTLITHYIFIKLSLLNGTETRNPGIRAFFSKNKQFLMENKKFTDDLELILNNYQMFTISSYGQLFNKFNGALMSFVLSFIFYRDINEEYLKNILKLGILCDITEYSYGHRYFKGFLEKINLKYGQLEYSDDELIDEIENHIKENFKRDEIYEILLESGIKNSLLYLNEYLYSKEKGLECNFTESVDIEHIMPQSGKNITHIMKDAEIDSLDQFNEYLEKIGNKILLEANINRSIGNSWFRTKRESTVQEGYGYRGSQYNIAKSLVNYPSELWTKTDINKATEKAAKRITDFIFE
ncbi:DUF262 domain-containing protein [Macrococcoides canis]|uniref:DUF262 domain-containing protein n=1 Tax=Macrococcoides canis TaxID=1855823 RepID=UPI0020B7D180|nr:DUF262 domain-containing protein [Macrococcus canis]UTH00527.1 DUF262 domain-containing protein [Macrococcus canis]